MLQVRNLPPDLHEALAERARAEGVSMSEYVTRLLRRDLARPTMREWAARVAAAPATVPAFDLHRTLDDVRVEYSPAAAPDQAPADTAPSA
ncbi:HicB family protein [Paraoerskovia marina]|uniref:HicB family protein n=2 Tax=Paraoerskovia marina TaxID=545619 RepID=A0A1H1M1Z1_9CELL|nr:HicB family protein [Paraoerskovia marina]